MYKKMWILLISFVILFSEYFCEWVEISQTYRKGSFLATTSVPYQYHDNPFTKGNMGPSFAATTPLYFKNNDNIPNIRKQGTVERLDNIVKGKTPNNSGKNKNINVSTTSDLFTTSLGAPFSVTKNPLKFKAKPNKRIDTYENTQDMPKESLKNTEKNKNDPSRRKIIVYNDRQEKPLDIYENTAENDTQNKINLLNNRNGNDKVTTIEYDESQIEESTTEKSNIKNIVANKVNKNFGNLNEKVDVNDKINDKLDEEDIEIEDDLTDESSEDPEHTKSERTYSGIIPVLKEIHGNMLKFEGRSIKSKIFFLSDLKERILYQIKNKISNLFSPKSSYETAKGYYEDDNHHMEFPSNEGALMTIGFLTFAAFLVKLVLKLIYALKYKQMYFYPTTTTTTAASIFLKKGRSISNGDVDVTTTAKVLKAVEGHSQKYENQRN